MIALLQDYVTQNAMAQPDRLMIRDGMAALTYGQMEAESNKLARHFVTAGLGRQDCVSLLMPKSIALFTALVATLKADAVYIPLNVQTPHARLAYILEQSRCRFLVCDASTREEAEALAADARGRVQVIIIGEGTAAQESDAPLNYQNTPENLAYVLYTSGSTGQPKGVMIPHRSVMNYASWTVDFFKVTPDDRFSNHPGLFFDLSVFEIYTAMKSGASLHLMPQDISMFPVKVVDFIERHELSIFNAAPSLYNFMTRARVLDPVRLSTLRVLTFNGEVMPTQTLISWMKACPEACFVNQYGPTETTCASMYYEIPAVPEDPSVPLPIGKPLAQTRAFALAEDGLEAGVGELGELHLLGAGLGHGYLFDEEKTNAAYLPHPLNPASGERAYATGDLVRLRDDGNYDYVCRKDHQIKVMGFRVELGEIETVLNTQDYVGASAVLGLPHTGTGDLMIVAFVVLKEDTDDARIKKDVGTMIPHYMVPREIVRMEDLPLNANGKTDRHKLKDLYIALKRG